MLNNLITVHPGAPPYGRLWLSIFVFAVCVAVAVQFVILGLLFPEWSNGHGLLLATDSLGYHQKALALAERIRAEGWSIWQLSPKGHFSAGLAAAHYVLFVPEPWVLIPLAAAAHALSWLILFRIALFFTDDWRIAALAAAPYILFPSSVFWYAQLLKDAYFNLGRRLISSQPDTNGRELDHGHVIRGQLVVARGDAAEVFDLVEEAFHEVARLVEMGAEADRVLAV